MRIRAKRRRANRRALFILAAVLAGLAVTGLLFLAGPASRALAKIGPGAADLNPAEGALLVAYLSVNAAQLTTPAGPDTTPVDFHIEPGETARIVAARLARQSLVRNAQLLTTYLRDMGLDDQVEAGDFILRQTMTVPEVARALTDASAREVTLRVTEGWRLEQIVEALAAHPGWAAVSDDFGALVRHGGSRSSTFSFLSDVGPDASLEGYLFPDTYLLRPDAPAADILDKLLTNFQQRLPAGYVETLAARGLTLHQAITIAALIEREAAVDEERALIASVIYNRLAAGQLLEIDASVQYAMGQPGDWWPSVAGRDLRAIVSPYNTYANPNLPPGPIANPGLASIEAAANPALTEYLYYRAKCDGSRRHAFAVTYEEHLANAC